MLDVVALVSSTILYYRTRHIYKVEYQEVHQHDEDMQYPHFIPNFTTGGVNMGHISSVSDLETTSSSLSAPVQQQQQQQHLMQDC